MADPKEVTLQDAAGKSHKYEIRPHPSSEGIPLTMEIMALGAEPLARLVKTWLDSGNQLEDADATSLESILDDIDWGQVGGDISRSLRLLANDPAKLQALFAYTYRDGKHLAHPQTFDDAYSANYAEWMKAIQAIVQANGFVPFSF